MNERIDGGLMKLLVSPKLASEQAGVVYERGDG